MKNIIKSVSILCLLIGCEEDPNIGKEIEELKIDISENKQSHFFPINGNFELTSNDIAGIDSLLKDSYGKGHENIGFMIISDKAIKEEQRETLSQTIISRAKKAGFLDSRITDSGICVYKNAKKGVRIDILSYDLKKPDTSWKNSIGDCNTNKNMPSYGTCSLWNLEEMVANKADLISPRKYKGQNTEGAVTALSEVNSSSSSNSSSSGSSSSNSSGSSSNSSSSSSSSKTSSK